jgi:hypothetical protein
MCTTVQEIMNGNHLWNDRMTKGNTICPRPFHGGGIKRKARYQLSKARCQFKFATPASKKPERTGKITLPNTSELFASAVADVNNRTPKKRNALRDEGILSTPSTKRKYETNSKIVACLKKLLGQLKRDTSKPGRNKYRIVTKSIVGRCAVQHTF